VPGLASCRLRPTASQGLGDMTEFCYVEDSAANVGADCPVGAAWVLESAPALSGPRLFVDIEAAILFCCGGREDQRIGKLFKQGRGVRGALCRERCYSVPSHLWLSQAPRVGNVPITYLSTAVDVLALLLGLCTDTARDSLKIAPSDVKRLTHCHKDFAIRELFTKNMLAPKKYLPALRPSLVLVEAEQRTCWYRGTGSSTEN